MSKKWKFGYDVEDDFGNGYMGIYERKKDGKWKYVGLIQACGRDSKESIKRMRIDANKSNIMSGDSKLKTQKGETDE